MSERADLQLRPHQQDLVEKFLGAEIPSRAALIAAPGTGKSTAVVEIIRQVGEKNPGSRILVLTRSAILSNMYHDAIEKSQGNLSTFIVNIRVLRELDAHTKPDDAVRSEGLAVLLSLHETRSESVRDYVRQVPWDLVVIDGGPIAHAADADLIEDLVRSTQDLSLLLAYEGGRATRLPDIVADLPTFNWRLQDLMSANEPLFQEELRQRLTRGYSRSEDEQHLLLALAELLVDIAPNQLPYLTILRLASSSIYAIEGSLIRLRDNLAYEESPSKDGEDAPSRPAQTRMVRTRKPRYRHGLRQMEPEELTQRLTEIDSLIQSLDRITVDRKMETLLELLKEIDTPGSSRRICVFSNYASTISYLHSTLASIEKRMFRVTGSIPHGKRVEEVARFHEIGGIMLVTDATHGEPPVNADIGICYDLPSNDQTMLQRWAAIDWMGRPADEERIMWAFRDNSAVILFEEELLRRYRFS